MRHKGLIILLAMILPLACNAGRQVFAQNNSPVQIDMSVLNAVEPAAERSEQAPYSRRSYRSSHPMLTNPQVRSRISSPVDDTPYEVPSKPKNEIVHFPVEIKDRTETYDPGLAKTPVYNEEAFVEQVDKKTTATPLPAFKPVAIASPKAKAANVPIPKRRPKTSHAPESYAEVVTKKTDGKKYEIAGAGRDGIPMPAVPAKRVDAEKLESPSGNHQLAITDELAKQLVTPNRMAMVKSIEAVTTFADALMPTTARIEARSLKSQNNINIPVPARKPVTHDAIVAKIEEAIDITEIEPAAGTAIAALADISEPAKERIPRQPPESTHEMEYVTLPFQSGVTNLDHSISFSLDDKVVSLLKSNPEWRLQIQSFASKTDNQLGNARRLSLSRALAVRSYLLDKGIEARRMDVRAMGMQTDRNPVDRVDFVFFDPNG